MKKFKKNYEDRLNLIQTAIDNNKKIEIHGLKKYQEPEEKKIITFDKMFEFLQSDKTFKIQNSYDPADKLIYKSKKSETFVAGKYLPEKMTTYDIRDIFYKSNSFNPLDEP